MDVPNTATLTRGFVEETHSEDNDPLKVETSVNEKTSQFLNVALDGKEDPTNPDT